MVWPVRRPNIIGFTPQQQVERLTHLPSDGCSKNRVGIGRYPPAIREAAAGIFVRPAWGLYDTIQGDMFKHNYFSHDLVPPTTGLLSGCLVQSRQTMSQMLFYIILRKASDKKNQ
jgi:hypothetical protein